VLDEQLVANCGFVEIDGGASGVVQRSVNGPVTFSDVAGGRAAPVPGLGQHTEEVLRELADRAGDPPTATS
jgi:crotonobetainyl-CoA:carnitine CoA-transferase CaiB-like acyl-CoA transferase